MALKKLLVTPDGPVEVDFTEAETTEYNAQKQANIDNVAAEKLAATQKATDKTNGNQKLLDLGLTQAEVDAITGQ